jgi:hypothetical protein
MEVNKYKDLVPPSLSLSSRSSPLMGSQAASTEQELKLLQLKNAEEFRILSSRITEAVARELTR